MANEYINPDFTGGSNDGSLSNPWVSWDDVTIVSGNSYFQKRGTTDSDLTTTNATLTKRHRLQGAAAGVVIGAYASDIDGSDDATLAKPIINSHYIENTDTSGWDQPDASGHPNVWRYFFTEVVNGGRDLLALRSLTDANMNNVRRADTQGVPFKTAGVSTFNWDEAPTQEGDYCFWNGAADPDFAAIYIYSEGNPVTTYGTIYMTAWAWPLFQFQGGLSTEIKNISWKYHAQLRLISFQTGPTEGTFSVHDCDFDRCRIGIVHYSQNTEYTITSMDFYNNTFTNIFEDGINCGGSLNNAKYKNLHIYNNTLSNIGTDHCGGGIYVGEHSNPSAAWPTIIENNTISTVQSGAKWYHIGGVGFDGAGIELDSTVAEAHVRYNTISNCEFAHLNNSGAGPNYFYGNKIYDCDTGISNSDSENKQGVESWVYNNVFYNCGGDNIPPKEPGSREQLNIIIKVSSTGNGTPEFNFYNNIFYGGDPDNTIALSINSYVNTNGTVNEGNNLFYNLTTDMDIGTPTDSVTTNPLLDVEYKPLPGSPCYEAGTYINNWSRDYNGRPFHIPPSMGVYEFTAGFPAQTRTAATTRSTASTRTART